MKSEQTYPKLNPQAYQKLARFKAMAEETVPNTRTDRFLILCREVGQAALNLESICSNIGNTEIIPDKPHPQKGYWYNDEDAKGFEGLMGALKFPPITAWSRAFAHLERNLSFNERVWFIEDDVAGHPYAFQALVKLNNKYPADLCANFIRTPKSDPDWYWWKHLRDPDWFKQYVSSFNPLCNLSSEFIQDILQFREKKGRFTFHEILFASLALKEGRSIIDWQKIPEARYLFGSFYWRPEIKSLRLGISHPVKDATTHNLITHITSQETETHGASS